MKYREGMTCKFLMLLLMACLATAAKKGFNLKNDLKALSHSLKSEKEESLNEYGLPEDMDYEVDDNSAKFQTLNDKTILYFIENYRPDKNNSQLLRGMKEEEVVGLVNTRPEVVVMMSQKQLEGILVHKPELMKNLTKAAAMELAGSQILSDKLSRISKNLFADFVLKNLFAQDFLKRHLSREVPLDSRLPGVDLLRQLLLDEHFLRLIPLQVHVELAESEFVNFLNLNMVKAILKANPDILLKFGPRGMKFVSSLLKKPGFVDQLSCAVIMNGATNPKFINQLSSEDLKVFTKSAHFWRCLPVDIIRQIMMDNKLGDKISINDVVVAAQVMSAAKSLDRQVVVSLLRIQFPKFAQRGFSEIFD